MKNIIRIGLLIVILAFQLEVARAVQQETKYPDLVVSGVTVNPASPIPGEKVTLAYRITNIGDNLYTSNGIESLVVTSDTFIIDGTPRIGSPIRIDQNNPLRQDGYFDLIVTGSFTKKGYTQVSATFDPENKIYEVGKGNNSYSHMVPVGVPNISFGTVVDLSIEEIFTEPLINVHAFEPVRIVVRVKNDGAPIVFSTPFTFVSPYFQNFVPTKLTYTTSRPFPTLDNPLKGEEKIDYIYEGYFSVPGQQQIYFNINPSEQSIAQRVVDDNFYQTKFTILDKAFIEKPTGVVLGVKETKDVYVVEDGTVRKISKETADAMGGERIVIGDLEFSKYTNAGTYTPRTEKYKDGTIVKGFYTPTVYKIEGGKKRAFVSERAFLSHGYDWYDIKTGAPEALDVYVEGEPIYPVEVSNKSLVKVAGNPAVYYIDGGIKHVIVTERAFTAHGFDWHKVITITPEELAKYAEGESIH